MDIRAEQKAELERRRKKGIRSELSPTNKAEMEKAVAARKAAAPRMEPQRKSRLEQLAASVGAVRDDAINFVKGKMKETRDAQTETKRRNVDRAVEGR